MIQPLFFVVGDFFEAGHFEALAMFDGGHEVAGIEEAFMGPHVEPGHAAAEEFDAEGAGL